MMKMHGSSFIGSWNISATSAKQKQTKITSYRKTVLKSTLAEK